MLILPEMTYVLYLLSLNLCYKWKIDYVKIHKLPQKIRVGCIYFDADPVGVGVVDSSNVSIGLNICTIYPERNIGF